MKPIIGHTKAQTFLNTLCLQQQLPHALLLHGSKGIGKRLLAERLALFLLCPDTTASQSETLSIDTNNPIYAQIQATACADYHVIQPAEGKKSISIEQIRTLLNQLTLTAEKNRVIIVDAAENMTTEATNALLKTLEEPGPGTYFCLISHQPSQLLPTLISRCRKLALSPLQNDETAAVLAELLPESTPEKRGQLAALSQGCPGLAYTLGEEALDLQQDILAAWKTPTLLAQKVADINQKKCVPTALHLLRTHLAKLAKQEQSIAAAKVHQDILRLEHDYQALNLTGAAVLEQALRHASSMLPKAN